MKAFMLNGRPVELRAPSEHEAGGDAFIPAAKKPRHEPCPKCGSRLIRAPYVIVCESVLCDYDARRGQ